MSTPEQRAAYEVLHAKLMVMMDNGQDNEAAVHLFDFFYALRGRERNEFLMTRTFIEIALRMSHVLISDKFTEEMRRRRAAKEQ